MDSNSLSQSLDSVNTAVSVVGEEEVSRATVTTQYSTARTGMMENTEQEFSNGRIFQFI